MKIKKILDLFTRTIGDNIEEIDEKELKSVYSLNHIRLWVFTIIGYGIFLCLIFVVLKLLQIKQNIGQIAVLIILFHFVVSWFNVVGKQQRGSVYFFGKPLFNVPRGICFVPWLVCSLDKEFRTFFEDELPTTQDKIYRSNRGEADFIPIELQKEGYKNPIRATFADFKIGVVTKYKKQKNGSYEEEVESEKVSTGDPFEERITLEVPGVIFWSIKDLIKFKSTIGDVEKARKQMAGVYIAIVTTDLPKITVKEFYKNREPIDIKIFTELDDLTDRWGVKIHVARIKEPKQSHNLSSKIQEMAEAKAKKHADELEGEGLGAREKAILVGRAKGLSYMAKKLNLRSENILSAESAREIANKVDNLVSVGSGGYADLLGIVAAGASAFRQQSKSKEKKEEEKKGGK